MFTFTWNFPNELAYPNRYEYLGPGQDSFVPETEKGTYGKGFEFLEEMERLGIIADVPIWAIRGILDGSAMRSVPLWPAIPEPEPSAVTAGTRRMR